MSFNSISSFSILDASNAMYLAKKKKKLGDKSDKLKRGKLDVTQVKNEGCGKEPGGGGKMDVPPMLSRNGKKQATRALEVTNDSHSLSSSLNSHTGSVVESSCSKTGFSGSGSGTSYSRTISKVDEDGGFDDWEAVADSLMAATDDKKDQQSLVGNKNVTQLDHLRPTATMDVLKQRPGRHDKGLKSGVEYKTVTKSGHLPEVVNQPTATVDSWKARLEHGQAGRCNDTFHSKPKPEIGQAGRQNDASHSKPKREKGQTHRGRYAFHSKPQSENGWSFADAFQWKLKPDKHKQQSKSLVKNKNAAQLDQLPEVVNQPTAPVHVWKPKPENGQASRCGDAFCWPKPEKRDQNSRTLVVDKNLTQLDHLPEVVTQPTATVNVWKPKPENSQATVDVLKPKPENGQAWRPGDVFRPKTLPNLEKKHNYSMEANTRERHGGTTLGSKKFELPPSSCPICCEDLDSTDSSFLPCSCGFQLCLFCHKRILEEDGRCPGCRKHYEGNAF